jgi:hypothetical protein
MTITHDKISSDLKDLFELSADTAISLIEKDSDLLPFMFKQKRSCKEHIVFTGEESTKQTINQALETTLHDATTLRFVLTYPGILTSDDGERSNAIILEGSEKGADTGFIFAQRYQQNEDGSYTWLSGNTFLKSTVRLRIH